MKTSVFGVSIPSLEEFLVSDFSHSPDRLSTVRTLKCYFQRSSDKGQDSGDLSHLRNIWVQICMIHQINYLLLFEL